MGDGYSVRQCPKLVVKLTDPCLNYYTPDAYEGYHRYSSTRRVRSPRKTVRYMSSSLDTSDSSDSECYMVSATQDPPRRRGIRREAPMNHRTIKRYM